MAHYLIEFRLRGFAKKYSQNLIKEVGRKFRVRGMKDKVSHITLFGPFTTNNERAMVSEVLNVCKQYDRIYFSIKGVDYFNNPTNKVVFLDITPSEDLKQFRQHLSSRLRNIVSTKSKEDSKNKDDFVFHSTIAFKDVGSKLNSILNHLKNKKHPNIRQTLLRVTIIKNGRILYEYDFLLKQLLNRYESLSKRIWLRTISILKQRPRPPLITKKTETTKHEKSLWNKIKSFFKGQ